MSIENMVTSQAVQQSRSRPDSKIDPELFISSQVAQGLAVIGDRRSFLILRDIYLGISRFEDLRKSVDCNRGTLASRLKELVEKDILFKSAYQEKPARYEYCLSPKGLDLYPIVLMMWRWEQRWVARDYLPQTLVHKSCGNEMLPVYKCKSCRKELCAHETDFSIRQKFVSVRQTNSRSQRRFKSPSERAGEITADNMTILDCVGDRWTSLVLAAGFFGLQRFDDMANAIGIGSSVLADRLSLLVKTGVMDRVSYQQRPARFEYHLSAKGRDLYAHTIAIHEWAERWLISTGKGLVKLRHLPCNKPFTGEVVCNKCDQVLIPQEVTYHAS